MFGEMNVLSAQGTHRDIPDMSLRASLQSHRLMKSKVVVRMSNTITIQETPQLARSHLLDEQQLLYQAPVPVYSATSSLQTSPPP